RWLLETLGESRAAVRSGIDPTLLDRERSLQELIDGKRDVRLSVLSRAHTEKEALAVQSELDELLTLYAELEGEIRARSPHHASLTQPDRVSAVEIQQLLDDDTLLLEFALGEPHS